VTGASSSVFADGIFSLSMWFSVGANPCSPNSRDKTLFAQQQSAEPWNWNDVFETGETDTCDSPPNSDADCSFTSGDSSSCTDQPGCNYVGVNTNVRVLQMCGEDGISTIPGDIIRTFMIDSAGQIASFDWSTSVLNRGTGGTKAWAHMVLSVDHTRAQVFVDGRVVPTYGFPTGLPEGSNVAYQGQPTTDDVTFSAALGDFPLSTPLTFGAAGSADYAWREFTGDIAAVSLHEDAMGSVDADCLFQYGQQQVGLTVLQLASNCVATDLERPGGHVHGLCQRRVERAAVARVQRDHA